MIGLLAATCSRTPGVNTAKVPGVDLSSYATYAYLPSGDTAGYRVAFDETVIQEVNQEMQARGYRLDRENPDLLVLFRSFYQEATAIERTPIYSSYDYYRPDLLAPITLEEYYYARYYLIDRVRGSYIREVEYSQGSFVVDIIDTSTKEIIWRGWSPTSVDPLALQSSIGSYVDNIFEEYPVPPQE